MAKKGDISIQTIVIAILALLVLVILAVMFITKMGTLGKNLDTCEAKGGACKSACGDYETRLQFVKCPDTEICCAGSDTAEETGSGDQSLQNVGP